MIRSRSCRDLRAGGRAQSENGPTRNRLTAMKKIFRSKLFRFVAIPLIGLVFLVLIGGGWYFSGVLEEDGLRVDNAAHEVSVSITGISADSITLQLLPDAEEDSLNISAQWGVTDGVNYGRLGDILSGSGEKVTREFTLMSGEFQVGDEVYLDRTAFPHDPRSAKGIHYANVPFQSELGELEAWYVPVESANAGPELWAIVVHGRTSNLDAAIKLLDHLNAASLTINYRNDEGAPASESGYYDFGATEWRDVEAAVQFALDNGAKRIVLVGFSMGGGVIVNYQLKSDLAGHTVGMILEAPMLNFGRTVDKGAAERGVPAPITAIAKMLASMRFGIDWDELDFLSHADELTIPILLIHGDADDTVPIQTSIEFEAASPSLIDLQIFEKTGHVAAWNWDPERYESLISEFTKRFD
ncbi:MAG TPA: alpha/beta fold hydrolase [Dehalococcoidia bacterium]|nr:alpha/beta fold hydrolase [Dehalococcoidia bacterium]